DLERSIVLQRGNALARGLNVGRLDVRHNDAGIAAGFGDDLAPRRHDQAVAVGLPAALMLAGLRGRKHEAASLDSPAPHHYLPIGLAGLAPERRWYAEASCP